MSVSSVPNLITFAEFEQLPELPNGHHELHHGEVVFMSPPPLLSHKLMERRLRRLFENMTEPHGYVADTEYAFRPLPESEVWVADVVCLSAVREEEVIKWLEGSPELVIEVKSSSSTKADLHDKAMTTLHGQGSLEFWIVDPETETVTVYTKTKGVSAYTRNDVIPLELPGLPVTSLSVNRIFNDSV